GRGTTNARVRRGLVRIMAALMQTAATAADRIRMFRPSRIPAQPKYQMAISHHAGAGRSRTSHGAVSTSAAEPRSATVDTCATHPAVLAKGKETGATATATSPAIWMIDIKGIAAKFRTSPAKVIRPNRRAATGASAI